MLLRRPRAPPPGDPAGAGRGERVHDQRMAGVVAEVDEVRGAVGPLADLPHHRVPLQPHPRPAARSRGRPLPAEVFCLLELDRAVVKRVCSVRDGCPTFCTWWPPGGRGGGAGVPHGTPNTCEKQSRPHPCRVLSWRARRSQQKDSPPTDSLATGWSEGGGRGARAARLGGREGRKAGRLGCLMRFSCPGTRLSPRYQPPRAPPRPCPPSSGNTPRPSRGRAAGGDPRGRAQDALPGRGAGG